MPEPIITGAVVTAAAKAAASEAGKDSASLLKRLLGPSVDEFGQALARSVAYRTRNFGRIAEKADRKATSMPADGIVSYRMPNCMNSHQSCEVIRPYRRTTRCRMVSMALMQPA